MRGALQEVRACEPASGLNILQLAQQQITAPLSSQVRVGRVGRAGRDQLGACGAEGEVAVAAL